MRVLGRASVASFLSVLVNVAWGLVALGLVLTPLMVVLAPVVEGPVEVNAGWVGVGTKMTIPVSFSVDARTHRVAAPSLGVEDAQLQGVRGLLAFPVGPARSSRERGPHRGHVRLGPVDAGQAAGGLSYSDATANRLSGPTRPESERSRGSSSFASWSGPRLCFSRTITR